MAQFQRLRGFIRSHQFPESRLKLPGNQADSRFKYQTCNIQKYFIYSGLIDKKNVHVLKIVIRTSLMNHH